MKFTSFDLFQNTPFTDFNNYINFQSIAVRDNFFNNRYGMIHLNKEYNFIRDRGVLRLNTRETGLSFNTLSRINYVRFNSDIETGLTYYAQVVESRYINDGTYEFHLVIDGFMTFGQGDISIYTGNNRIERQHLTKETFNNNLQYLRTNSDIIQFNNLEYVSQALWSNTAFFVIMRSSVDLTKDFGDKNNPTQSTSRGNTYDKVTSPQNLYLIEYSLFNDFMAQLSDYPWIAQNITDVKIIPEFFIDTNDLTSVKISGSDFGDLRTFKKNASSKTIDATAFAPINNTLDIIDYLIGAPGHPELLRQPYANIEATNWQGQSIEIDPAYLPSEGLQWRAAGISGYDNHFSVFPWKYKANGEEHIDGLYSGAYLNNAIHFNEFDSVPILIDQYKLSLAENAHMRQYAQSNLITNQAKAVADPSQSLLDRFMNGASLVSDFSFGALQGKLTDEWQFYRKQKAEFADKKISKPSISEQSTTNAFNMKHGTFGVTVKYSTIPAVEKAAIIAYHANFGYEWDRTGTLENIRSMSHMNYFKFDGNWTIPGV